MANISDPTDDTTDDSSDDLDLPRLTALAKDYWAHSGGISIDDARKAAQAESFAFHLGRQSRFDNRRGVVIASSSLRDDRVNRIELAEEIQHGIDRAANEATTAIAAGKTNARFHADVYRRIIENHKNGRFNFLSPSDIQALDWLAKELSTK